MEMYTSVITHIVVTGIGALYVREIHRVCGGDVGESCDPRPLLVVGTLGVDLGEFRHPNLSFQPRSASMKRHGLLGAVRLDCALILLVA